MPNRDAESIYHQLAEAAEQIVGEIPEEADDLLGEAARALAGESPEPPVRRKAAQPRRDPIDDASLRTMLANFADEMERATNPWSVGMGRPPIPERMRPVLLGYICEGRPVGDFLDAVLQNDLQRAVGHADSENLAALPTYVGFLYNYAPAACYGSPADYRNWLEAHRLRSDR